MDLFQKAEMVRLRSHHDKYLAADENNESVSQSRDGSSEKTVWTVEPVPDSPSHLIRLKSCYGKYLTASRQLFLTGRKVLQTMPKHFDYSHEWQPMREPGSGHVKFRTRQGHFLRANGWLPPWRSCVTHDVPFRTATQDWVLWDIEIVACHVSQPVQDTEMVKQKPNVEYEEAMALLSNIVRTQKHDLKGVAAARINQLSAELEEAASPNRFDALERIRSGFLHFKTTMFDRKPEYFHKLSQEQHPKFMVFACSDSRVSPTYIFNFKPGEAFMVRNIANIVPPYDQYQYVGVGACIEYAVTHLKVENILIVGHSRCGGIKALMDMPDDGTITSQFVEDWMQLCSDAKKTVKSEYGHLTQPQQCYHCEKEAVNVSLGNLLTYPFVRAALMKKTLALRGAHYDFVKGSYELWDLDPLN